MKIHIKQLFDEHGCVEYIFYETGKFTKPLFVLSEGYAETLKHDLNKLINGNEYRVIKLIGKSCKK